MIVARTGFRGPGRGGMAKEARYSKCVAQMGSLLQCALQDGDG